MGVTRAATFEFSGVKRPMSKQIRSLSKLYCYAKTKNAAIVEALIKKDVLEKVWVSRICFAYIWPFDESIFRRIL